VLDILIIKAEGTEAVQAAMAFVHRRLNGDAPVAPVSVQATPPHHPRILARAKPEPAHTEPRPSGSGPVLGRPGTLLDAVRKAVRESPRTNTEVFDALKREGYVTTSGSLGQMLSSLRKANEIYKDEELKWRVAVGH